LKNHQRFWQRIGNNSVIGPSSISKYNGKNHPEREATWEKEEDLRIAYPEFFRYILPQTLR
jgi:hypothetical protein